MKQKGKRVLAIILSFIIILGCINGTGIQASETDNDNTADEDVSVDAGDEYSIAIGKMEHGTITAINDTEVSGSALVVTTAVSGSAVKVNIMPDNEYRLKEMKVSYKTEAPDEKNEEIKAEKSKDDDFVYIFTMPAADVTIDAEFIKYDEESDLVSGKDNYIVIDGTSGIMGSGEANQKAEIYNLFNGSEYALEEKQLKFLNESDQNPDTAERVANTTAWEFAGKEGSVEFETRSPIVPCGYQLEMPSGYYETKDNTKCPDSWVLKARLNKNEEWTEISRITNDKLLEYRDKDDYLRNYPCDNDNNKVYRYFRLEISGNKGGDNTILEELRMWDKKVPSYSITSVISTDDIQFLKDESVKLTTKVVALDGTENGSEIKLNEDGTFVMPSCDVKVMIGLEKNNSSSEEGGGDNAGEYTVNCTMKNDSVKYLASEVIKLKLSPVYTELISEIDINGTLVEKNEDISVDYNEELSTFVMPAKDVNVYIRCEELSAPDNNTEQPSQNTDETDEEENTEAAPETGSAIGTGNVIKLIIMVAVFAVAGVGYVLFQKKRNKA